MRKPKSNRNIELKPKANFIKKLEEASQFNAAGSGLTLTQFLELQANTPKNTKPVKVTPPKRFVDKVTNNRQPADRILEQDKDVSDE
jgi:hypothetical protein